MKKAKLMIGVLTLSAVLLGTGYAAWTDQLTLGTTATTGSVCVKYGEVELDEDSKTGESEQNVSVNNERHTLNFTFTNLASQNKLIYTTTFENKGTLSVDLNQITPTLLEGNTANKKVTVDLWIEDQKVAEGNLADEIGLIDSAKKVDLAPGEGVPVKIQFYVNDDGKHTDGQGKTSKFGINFDWTQADRKVEIASKP